VLSNFRFHDNDRHKRVCTPLLLYSLARKNKNMEQDGGSWSQSFPQWDVCSSNSTGDSERWSSKVWGGVDWVGCPLLTNTRTNFETIDYSLADTKQRPVKKNYLPLATLFYFLRLWTIVTHGSVLFLLLCPHFVFFSELMATSVVFPWSYVSSYSMSHCFLLLPRAISCSISRELCNRELTRTVTST